MSWYHDITHQLFFYMITVFIFQYINREMCVNLQNNFNKYLIIMLWIKAERKTVDGQRPSELFNVLQYKLASSFLHWALCLVMEGLEFPSQRVLAGWSAWMIVVSCCQIWTIWSHFWSFLLSQSTVWMDTDRDMANMSLLSVFHYFPWGRCPVQNPQVCFSIQPLIFSLFVIVQKGGTISHLWVICCFDFVFICRGQN